MKRAGRLVFHPTQLFQSNLKLAFSRQGDSAGGAAIQADLAAGEAAKRVRHERPAGFGVPFKDVVRAEVEALEVRAADVRINRGKPREFLAKIAQQGHSSILYASHE